MCSRATLAQSFLFFFFNDTATTEIYTLSLHDALPICWRDAPRRAVCCPHCPHCAKAFPCPPSAGAPGRPPTRSEEHTSELQSQSNLVCRLLLEKKKKNNIMPKQFTTKQRQRRRAVMT